jgi:23S rRNA pseudouridine2605 synthase
LPVSNNNFMDKEERLQKLIAASGITSRRKAETLIQEGRVTVNGQVVTQLGTKANPESDYIKVDGKLIRDTSFKKTYILLNKPRQVICTVADPQKRTTVIDMVNTNKRIFPIGRLDYNTEGLILLTDDGDFSKIMSSAGKLFSKVYHVKVQGSPDALSLRKLRNGIHLRGGVQLASCKIEPIKEGANSWYEVTLTQGKNRQIREMFEAIGHPVSKLRRVRIGFLTDKGLSLGHHRNLTPIEIERVFSISRTEATKQKKKSDI